MPLLDVEKEIILRIADATFLRNSPDLTHSRHVLTALLDILLPLTPSRHVLTDLLDILLCEDNLSLIWEP